MHVVEQLVRLSFPVDERVLEAPVTDASLRIMYVSDPEYACSSNEGTFNVGPTEAMDGIMDRLYELNISRAACGARGWLCGECASVAGRPRYTFQRDGALKTARTALATPIKRRVGQRPRATIRVVDGGGPARLGTVRPPRAVPQTDRPPLAALDRARSRMRQQDA